MSGISLALEAASFGAAGSALSWVTVSPTSGFWGPVHSRAPLGGPDRFALTFDDGPTRESTSAILDLLGELGVRAAFFVIGVNARRCPDLLARMHAEGHIIANHSLDHAHLGMFGGPRYWDRQLRETDRIIEEATGARPAFFRPPMGFRTCYVMGAAAGQGHEVITWSRRAMDGVRTTTSRILDRLVPHARAGDVLLLHDGVEPRGWGRDPAATVAAIKPLILQLRNRGLEPTRLDELLRLRAYAAGATGAAAR